ncbi:MAG: hypothetical protein H7145_23885 [Akkermansiaceae bacterium]|nr:hypothetical protein [Armatimonadota bacterium]
MNTQADIADNLNSEADAIITAFADALENGGASVADWSGRHPQLGRDFARIAAQNFGGWAGGADNATTERLQRVAQGVLLKHKSAYLGVQVLTSLVDKERGITAANIAQATSLPLPFVAKLNQRLFTAASIPATLVGRVAEAIGRTTEDVVAFLAGPPMLARAAAYRADDAPVVGEQEDFRAALLSDASVSPEARATYSVNG